MNAILVDGVWLCSPECARAFVDELDAAPDSVTLHDPQFVLSREELSAEFGEDTSGITRTVDGADEAVSAIAEFESMFPSPFRPGGSD